MESDTPDETPALRKVSSPTLWAPSGGATPPDILEIRSTVCGVGF